MLQIVINLLSKAFDNQLIVVFLSKWLSLCALFQISVTIIVLIHILTILK